ncbi:MAG TPA: hypothetical protein VFU15_09545, partial [Bacteroidia bacterium]|nr:hypothetical protein [Bacteroidia bacterium]
MSTENKTIGYIFPEADKFLKEKLLGMRKTAIKLFGTLGRQNKPLPDDTDIRSTVATIKAGHEHLFAEEMHHIKPEVHHAAFRSREKETDQKRAALDDEAEKLTHNIITAEHKIEGKTRPKTRKRSPWAVAFLILLYFGETVLNSLALEVGGGMPIWAAILAAAITGIEAVIAYRIARNIERLEAEGKK